jgi:hypothetical protein
MKKNIQNEVGLENFKTGNALLDKAWQKINQANPEDMTIDQAIKMAQLGLKIRHESAGLLAKFQIESEENINIGSYPLSAQEVTQEQSHQKNLADKLEAFLQMKENESNDV